MRALVIAAVAALLVGSLSALVWRRPDPKHALMFSLVERLGDNLANHPAASGQPDIATRKAA
jgi:hypothetical protein